MHTSALVLSCFCSGLAYLQLWARIIREREKPHDKRQPLPKATWVAWFAVDIGFATLARGAFAFEMWVYALGTGSIAIYAVSDPSSTEWSRRDLVVAGGACLALALRLIAAHMAAGCLLLVAAVVGAWPLLAELWQDSAAEGAIAWWCFWMSGLTGLIAASSWRPERIFVPAGLFALQSVIVWLTIRTRSPRYAAGMKEESPEEDMRLAA